MSLTVAFALGMLAMYVITGIGLILSDVIGFGYTSDCMMWCFCWWIALPLMAIRLVKNAIRRRKRLDKTAQK
jgi:hypothetical protein